MSGQNDLGDMYVLGIEGSTYRQLLEIAKKKGCSVNELTADALKKALEDEKRVTESRKILTG